METTVEEQVQHDIQEAKAQLEINDTSSSANPLSHFRLRLVPNLSLNYFNKSLSHLVDIHPECDEMIKCALETNDFEMFKEILWLIKDENDQNQRKALILKYIRVCCSLTSEQLNDCVDHLLEYLHQDIETTWTYDIGFLFELLHNVGMNVEKLINLIDDLKIAEVLHDVQLKWKLNYDDPMQKEISSSDVIQSIRRVFRIVLSLGYFQVEKLKSSLSNDHHLFLFLLGFYLQLDKRFQDMNNIHIARRLMVNAITLLESGYWNERRDLLVECLYTLSSKNVYIIELFLKTNERTVRLRTQLALLHLKRLVNMIEHEKKSEAAILEEIIQSKLDPRRFDRSTDFTDCIRLLADIIDSYPYDQQIIYLTKLYKQVRPFVRKTHEKSLTNEQYLMLYDDCARWETMLQPVLNNNDLEKLIKRK